MSEEDQTAGGHVQDNEDDNQEGTQGAHIIVNNESGSKTSYQLPNLFRLARLCAEIRRTLSFSVGKSWLEGE